MRFQTGCLVIQAWWSIQIIFVTAVAADRDSWWVKAGPFLAKTLTWAALIVVPIANIAYFAYRWIAGDMMSDSNLLRAWCATFAAIGVTEILAFFVVGSIILD